MNDPNPHTTRQAVEDLLRWKTPKPRGFPWGLFWCYFLVFAMIAASVSAFAVTVRA